MTRPMERLKALRTRLDQARASSRALRWSLDAAVILLVVLGVGAFQARGHVRGAAPQFTVATLDGAAPVTLEDLRGKPVVLAFWAPWCTVCKQESPNLDHVKELLGDQVHVVTVASHYQNVDELHRYMRERGARYPVLLGGDVLAQHYRVSAFPTVYFLDGEGRIKSSVVGYTTTAGLAARALF